MVYQKFLFSLGKPGACVDLADTQNTDMYL